MIPQNVWYCPYVMDRIPNSKIQSVNHCTNLVSGPEIRSNVGFDKSISRENTCHNYSNIIFIALKNDLNLYPFLYNFLTHFSVGIIRNDIFKAFFQVI